MAARKALSSPKTSSPSRWWSSWKTCEGTDRCVIVTVMRILIPTVHPEINSAAPHAAGIRPEAMHVAIAMHKIAMHVEMHHGVALEALLGCEMVAVMPSLALVEEMTVYLRGHEGVDVTVRFIHRRLRYLDGIATTVSVVWVEEWRVCQHQPLVVYVVAGWVPMVVMRVKQVLVTSLAVVVVPVMGPVVKVSHSLR